MPKPYSNYQGPYNKPQKPQRCSEDDSLSVSEAIRALEADLRGQADPWDLRRGSLPRGSMVVPFWDYLIGLRILNINPQKERNYFGACG